MDDRVSFAVPVVSALWLVYHRFYEMKAASNQLAVAKAKPRITGYDTKSLLLTFRYFAFRLLATAGICFTMRTSFVISPETISLVRSFQLQYAPPLMVLRLQLENLGALVAAVMYNYISTTQKFHAVPWFGPCRDAPDLLAPPWYY
ncbi:hypothetical protein PRK78_005090 [Emydomyces testavorans]|uniref:Uncharacterized protein n=1 Tax=Emydomyces testavorans TaxID=2070801 RepID=A0AAF0DJN1_9EURO|nr:hypothetical protein PRK78_005090 [Emydomyces testavorans]